MPIDYSLYLVTDSSPEILGDKSLLETVEAAVKGGVTIVQYRNKTGSTASLIKEAKQLHEILKRYDVPLIINDRVDIAVAIGAEGVHIGQDDIDIETVRNMLRHVKDPIIGVTASSIDEARHAVQGKATYLGLGTVFATPTKKDTKSIIGIAGVREILVQLHHDGAKIPSVCIGGVNASNIQRVIYGTTIGAIKLSGVAVVSAIMGHSQPEEGAKQLQQLISTAPSYSSFATPRIAWPSDAIREQVVGLVRAVAEHKPLCHNMTNTVVQNFAANVAIAIGGSPIMSNNGAEAADLAKLGGSLVVNMGTSSPEAIKNQIMATQAYNAAGGPVLLDPVGAGATAIRRQAVKDLMAGGYFDVIKGNEGEIMTVANVSSSVQQHGVDSVKSTLSSMQKADIVEELAQRERCVVVMSGEVDIVSDGVRTAFIRNGHRYMGEITGSGCSLGTTIAAFLAVGKTDKLVATIVAVLLYNIAAQVAAIGQHVQGPGSFVPAWIDQLHKLKSMTVSGDSSWFEAADMSLR